MGAVIVEGRRGEEGLEGMTTTGEELEEEE